MQFRLLRHPAASGAARARSKQQLHDRLVHLALTSAITAVVTAVIVYFMPRSSAFDYDYEPNQPWRYAALYATQKYNVRLGDEDIAARRDSVARAFQPYFTLHEDVAAAMKDSLRSMRVSEAGHGAEKVPVRRDAALSRCIPHVAALLDTVYSRGVVSPSAYDSLAAASVPVLRVIRGNVAEQRQSARVLTTQSAYQYILNHDTEHFAPALLARLNVNTLLEPNLVYNREKSEQELRRSQEDINTLVGVVMANERIVDRGEIVTPEVYLRLRSYASVVRGQESEQTKLPYILFGQIVAVLLVVASLVSYLSLFRRDYLTATPRAALLLFALLTALTLAASFMVSHHVLHVFILPCCVLPIIVRVFLDSRTAFVFHVGTVLLISLQLSYPYEFIILQLVTGLIAIQNLRELSQRSQIISTATIITLTYIVFYTAYELIIGTSVGDFDHSTFVMFCANGILLLFTYPLLWVLEKSFGFTSDVTLVELSNINHPLLATMTKEAPGTFQHSMQVANLAGEAAKAIGAKVQLVRTGALYHDIGKIERPVFFTENQSGANPHKHLTPERSAQVIIAHVTNGLRLAEQYHLPAVLRRFIATHHGRGLAKYFYVTWRNEHPDAAPDESAFRYPGPNPATREEAVLMMTDSVEAASRSLPEYTEESISALVDRIVDAQVAEGFFTECEITFRNIADVKAALKEGLRTIYHTRISYPELQTAAAEKADDGKGTVNN